MLSYDSYVAAIKKGRCYVSDGNSHIIDFSVNGMEAGTKDSKLLLNKKQPVNITARVAANLPEHQDEAGAAIAHRDPLLQPYWHIERARIGTSGKVGVELVINGKAVDTAEIIADGKWVNVSFSYPITASSWVALRILPSSHTNPVFIQLNGKPVREPHSAEWCLRAVDQCWKMKQSNIRPSEQAAAKAAYDSARRTYEAMTRETPDE
ncbi:MAG: CehA/McbA family metallohydrolase [Ferruginibacter sp.]